MTPYPRKCVALARRGAFSLIELILVIALVGVLVALILPSLAGARAVARRTVVISHLRSHAAVMSMYADDSKEYFPYTTFPEATYTVRRHPSGYARLITYFGGYNSWHWPLLDGYYDAQPDNAAFRGPGDDVADDPFSPFWYSATFIAAPEFWNPATRTGPQQWRATKLGDVTFPSAKGLLVHRPGVVPNSPQSRQAAEIAFADTSARRVPAQRLTRAYPNGEGDWPGSWFPIGISVMHTIDGVRGRDVK